MRARLTGWIERLATVALAPALVAHRLRIVSFRTVGEVLSLAPGHAGLFLRRAWYERTLAACGHGLSVSLGAVIHERRTRIGDRSHIGAYTWVGYADIGSDVMVASHAELLSGLDQYGTGRHAPMRAQPNGGSQIRIGSDVWIGSGARVGADVAAHCIVAAGAVVVRPARQEYAVLAGVPATVVATRPA